MYVRCALCVVAVAGELGYYTIRVSCVGCFRLWHMDTEKTRNKKGEPRNVCGNRIGTPCRAVRLHASIILIFYYCFQMHEFQ